MENKIIDLNYLKTLNDMGIHNFDFTESSQFREMLDKLFKIPLKDHHLFKELYNVKRYSYFIKISSSKTEINSRSPSKEKVTIYHDFNQNILNALFLERDFYTYFVYFDKNFLYSKYRNQKLTTKIEIDEHLIPIKDNYGFFPNGSPKVVEEFNNEHAIKITTHHSLKGKEHKKIVELRDGMFATIFQKTSNEIEVLSNNPELKKFLEEHITDIKDFNDILPLIELNFI